MVCRNALKWGSEAGDPATRAHCALLAVGRLGRASRCPPSIQHGPGVHPHGHQPLVTAGSQRAFGIHRRQWQAEAFPPTAPYGKASVTVPPRGDEEFSSDKACSSELRPNPHPRIVSPPEGRLVPAHSSQPPIPPPCKPAGVRGMMVPGMDVCRAWVELRSHAASSVLPQPGPAPRLPGSRSLDLFAGSFPR